jgi:dTDP-4-amino-4,6-dideoxygalactose transaminase
LQVPLLDLKAQFATIEDEIMDAVACVLKSQVCIGGPNVTELERAVAAKYGCAFAVAMSSGTDALLSTMMALQIGPGDEVITTPFTFFATVGCIARLGATPVFVDIDRRTYNLDPALLHDAVTSKTRAIVPVHLFGQMADMDPILAIAEEHGLAVVEDAAQAIGATYKGRSAGAIGTAGCFSFFPSKNLGAAGDGGMVVTNDPALHRRLVTLRNHGAQPKYFHHYVGGNFRLDAIQAAILLVKLRRLDWWHDARRRNAAYYNTRFGGSHIGVPYVAANACSIYNQYVVRLKNRDELLDWLRAKQIGCEIYYPLPMHLQPCFAYLGIRNGCFPEAEAAAQEVLALPVYPELSADMLAYVADSVLAWMPSAIAATAN